MKEKLNQKDLKKVKKEDEIFQKKIREIKLQRQFLQLGRDAVEFKQFKQIEDGIERKINDRQNQDLIEQLDLEKVKWVDIKMRYDDSKKENKNMKELLNNYNKAYDISNNLNNMINEEDKTFKRAVHDRERALNKFLQEDIKEKNKFCFKMQEKTLKKPSTKNRSQTNPKSTINFGVNPTTEKSNTNLNNNNTNSKQEDTQKLKEGSDEEEKNDVQKKLENEKTLSQKQATHA